MFNWKPLRNCKGQGMVEYILIVVVVVAIIFGAYKLLGQTIKKQFNAAQDTVSNAGIDK